MMDSLCGIVDYDTDDDSMEESPSYNLQSLPEGSPVPAGTPEPPPASIHVGEMHQVEVPDFPVQTEMVLADNQFLIGMPVPLTWVDSQENNGPVPVPGMGTSQWTETEVRGLVLGLYIFGKNLRLTHRFIESKSIGDVLAYYYGVFYKSETYKKWVECRKARTRKCIVGARIFTGWRQQEFVSRLQSAVPQEKHEPVLEAIKSFNDNSFSFEDFIFFLRSTIGLQTFVDAVAIGKGREDLTGPCPDSGRAAHPAPARPEIPSGKACSSLSPPEIIKFLTGDFRLSKARANDLFWEAIWPRMLARGWHSEQPRDLIGSKNSLVFLMPGIKKFSRKLIKIEHYYDCVSDVLRKVAADPELLNIDNIMVGNVDGECGPGNMSASPKEYLRPKARPHNGCELMRFMVVDTSMLHDEKRMRVRDFKSLPPDIDVGNEPVAIAGPSRIAISSDSSDSEALINRVQINAPLVEGVHLGHSSIIDAVVNGHVETTSIVNGVKGHFGKISQSSKPKTHKYLSPVPKRRRLSGCKQQGVSQKSLPFSKGNINETGYNGSVLSATVDKGRESDHPRRKRKIKLLVKEVMKEGTDLQLGSSGMFETVQGDPRAEPVFLHNPKEVGASSSTSPRKKKVRRPKVAKNECNSRLEMLGDQTKTEFDSSAEVNESVKGTAPTKRKRKMTNLFREAVQSDDNAMPHYVNGSVIGTLHDSDVSEKPKKVVRRRRRKPSLNEVKKEIELLSISDPVHKFTQPETKEIEIPKPQLVKEEPKDNPNEPETALLDVGTCGTSNALEPSESNAVASGRRVSTRNRPPTVRALEAVANGFLGGPKQRTVSASSRRARKSGIASRRSRKMEETVVPIPSEDADVVVLSATIAGELSNGNADQHIVDLTDDVQPNMKTLDHVVGVEFST